MRHGLPVLFKLHNVAPMSQLRAVRARFTCVCNVLCIRAEHTSYVGVLVLILIITRYQPLYFLQRKHVFAQYLTVHLAGNALARAFNITSWSIA